MWYAILMGVLSYYFFSVFVTLVSMIVAERYNGMELVADQVRPIKDTADMFVAVGLLSAFIWPWAIGATVHDIRTYYSRKE